jgi:uncharacterized Fe-S center protein
MGRVDLQSIAQRRDLVAIKLHFGEKGNTAFIRPTLVRQVVDYMKEGGACPFLTDTNTLYTGARADSVSHLHTVVENGFAYSVVNAPIIIADGIRGASSMAVSIQQEHIQTAFIGQEIAEADALIGVSHFKGHELTGFAGALKNLGMGCAARKGKLAQHSGLSPKVKRKKCIACGDCVKHCAHSAIFFENEKAKIDQEACVGCGECLLICDQGAIQVQWNADIPLFQKKMVEYAFAVLKNKKGKVAFLNFLSQVSPACDCCGHSDAPIVQDLGVMASLDPVAVDQASVDMVNQQIALDTSCLSSHKRAGEDKFKGLYPKVDWTIQLRYAQQLGLGNREYDLVSI